MSHLILSIIMKKVSYTILFSVFLLVNVQGQNKLSFELLFKIGDENRAEYYFRNPQLLTHDSKNNIYVVDQGATIIKVFNSEGEYIGNFGRNGKGPGEFLTISSLDHVGDDTLTIFDGLNQRITKLTREGSFETYPSERLGLGYIDVKNIISYSNNYLIYMTPNNLLNKNRFFLVERNFQHDQKSYGEGFKLWNNEDEFLKNLTRAKDGVITSNNENEIYFTPIFLENYIIRIDLENNEGERIYSDYIPNFQSYIQHDLKDFNKNIPNKILMNGVSGRFVIQAVNKTLGLFHEDGYIYHFFIHKISEDNSALSVNIFSNENRFVNNFLLQKYDGHPVNSSKVLAFKNQRLYLTQTNSDPTISVYKLEIKQ